jgi:tRNA A-37 threonylcarbamoyl transferase component Bud32
MNLHLPNDIRWHVDPELSVVIAAGKDNLSTAIARGAAELIKNGRFRTVYRVHLPRIDIYVKHCRPADWRAWLRECLRPAKALLEFRNLRAAAARRVPTVVALGWGTRHRFLPGDSILITRAIPDAEPLGRYLMDKLPQLPALECTRKRQVLAKSLGRFLADLHRAGVVHPDLHPDNLLLSWSNEFPAVHLLDLHDVQTSEPCGKYASLRNLAMLNRWFALRASRTDRLRFWRAYIQRRWECDSTKCPWEWCRDLERLTLVSNLRLWRSWADRCFGNNRRFAKLREHHIAGHVIKEITANQLQSLLADPDVPFRRACALLKNSRSSTVTEVDVSCRVGGAQRNPPERTSGVCCAPPTLPKYIYKCFRNGSIWDSIANLIRRPPSLRSWQNGHAFLNCLLPTPRPIAVWHRRWLGLLREGYLLTEKIADAEDLQGFLRRTQALPMLVRIGLLRQVLDELGRQVRKLHERGWAHRDLKATNILIQLGRVDATGESPQHRPLSPEGKGRIWFIDLVGVWRPWWLSEFRRQKDLSRLNVSFCSSEQLSLTDRLRFLRAYLNWNLHGKNGWKTWWQAIAKYTAAKIRQNQIRGRPLT